MIGSAMMIGCLAISITLFSIAARSLRWLEQTKALGYARLPLIFDLAVAGAWILLVLSLSVWGYRNRTGVHGFARVFLSLI